MYKILNKIFRWDYIYWNKAAPKPPIIDDDEADYAELYSWLRDNGATFWTGVNTDNEVEHHVCEWAMDDVIRKAIKEDKL